jgi:hypothetical protein
LYTKSKCQFDNEVHRQNSHIEHDLVFIFKNSRINDTHTVKVITVRLKLVLPFLTELVLLSFPSVSYPFHSRQDTQSLQKAAVHTFMKEASCLGIVRSWPSFVRRREREGRK